METPAFIVDEDRIRQNCETLALVKERTGCKVLLALKGFALWPLFPLVRQYLDGTCASSPWEARLGRERFGGEVHAYAAAYSDAAFAELLELCDEIDFNSFNQLEKFGRDGSPSRPGGAPGGRALPKFGLRINPACSTQDSAHAIYDPCAPQSRLGIRRAAFDGQNLDGISGLHFHTLCEQNADALAKTLQAVEEQFGDMAHYSMVKTTFFNGIQHPDIAILRNGKIDVVREFGYEDYKNRLA